MTIKEATTTIQESDALVLSLARVAHEVCASLAVSQGDFTMKPWEQLPEDEQKLARARVTAFLNNPGMHPTAEMGPAVAVMSMNDRAKAYVFHGVVHAIAREQSRS